MYARHVLVGVDESHNDSKDAIVSAMSFASHRDSKMELVSVFGKNTTTPDLKKHLLRAYEDDVRGAPVQVGVRSVISDNANVAVAFLEEAHKTKADLLAIGAGAVKSNGSLGSVAQKIVEGSHCNVLVAKRHNVAFVPGAPREFLVAVDNSTASNLGLKQLLALCNDNDKVSLVVISDRGSDADILDEVIKTNADEIARKSIVVTKKREALKGRTAGAVLCDLVSHDVHALVVCSANSSAKALGSTTKYCLGHCPISVLVLKVFFAV